MTDTNPLLQQSEEAGPETTPQIDKHLPSLGELIEQSIGEFGWSQFKQTIIVALARLFDGQQTLISVYTDAEPTWHCTDETICNSRSDICKLPNSAWAWNEPSYKTIVSDLNLECNSSSFITSLPASSFLTGCLLGGFILATLADSSSLGRKNLLLLSCLTMSVTALATMFSTNVWIYSALRFISGFGRASIGACGLVLSTETVSSRWRGQVGIIGFLMFTLGYLSLPAIAYINRGSSWRTLYLWTSIPAILYCPLVYFFVSESPRWLFTQGRNEEAMAILKRVAIAPANSSSSLNLCLRYMHFKKETHSSIKNLFDKRWAFHRLLMIMLVGFGVGMVYYGMQLGVGNFGFNIYLSVTFNALAEFASFTLTSFFIGVWNRKSSLLGFSMVSGVCSIMCVIIGNDLKRVQIGLELLAFFCDCAAFAVLILYTLELFPTTVRNSATSVVRQATMFGAVFSPMLISAGRKNMFLSYGVFGVIIVFCALFVVWLPETKGATLCDTMEEQEGKENVIDQSISV